MLISDHWLKDYFDSQLDPHKTAEILTDLGLEVEGIVPFESVKGSLEGVIVGEVIECKGHPNADRLKVTKVNLGNSTVQIVCGAPNVAKGQKVAVALVGTTIYGTDGSELTLKRTKIRGEESEGMICAEDELGIGSSHDGIVVLEASLKPGTPLAQVFPVYKDTVYEIGLTPNRADAMGHYGVARDLRAGLGQNKQLPPLSSVSISHFSIENYSTPIEIDVLAPEKAPRYLGIVVSNLQVNPSPEWLQNRLKAIGLTPINNVVDVTNFVLHGLGQPLHAFDYEKISQKKIVVRNAEKDEKLITLDGVERSLNTEDLVICDAEKPLCIAGVYGGLASGVSESTTSVLLESAYFDPISIRKTSKRHGLHTDASFRFERGVDISFCKVALKRAAVLLKELANGTISSDLIELYPKEAVPVSLFLNYDKLNKTAGAQLPSEHVKSILAHLEFKVLNETEAGLGIVVPVYRNDVTREIDVIEEVLRVYGYNRIPIPEKFFYAPSNAKENTNITLQNEVAEHLVALGYTETLSNSLTQANENSTQIELQNALSSDLQAMRTELLSSGLKTVAFNSNRQQKDLKIFEFGKVYSQEDSTMIESHELLLMATGRRHPQHWMVDDQKVTLYDLKSLCYALLQKLELNQFEEKPIDESSLYSESIGIFNKTSLIAQMGIVHPKMAKAFGVSQPVVGARLNWDYLIENAHQREFKLKEISKHPIVYRDLALILEEATTFGEIYIRCFEAERKLLKAVNLFDVYTGKGVPESKKSYAIQLQFGDTNKTLTDKEIDKAVARIYTQLQTTLNAELRT